MRPCPVETVARKEPDVCFGDLNWDVPWRRPVGSDHKLTRRNVIPRAMRDPLGLQQAMMWSWIWERLPCSLEEGEGERRQGGWEQTFSPLLLSVLFGFSTHVLELFLFEKESDYLGNGDSSSFCLIPYTHTLYVIDLKGNLINDICFYLFSSSIEI